MELTPDETRMIETHRAAKAISEGRSSNAGLHWILDAIYAVIQVGKAIWPDFDLWDVLQGDVESHDPRP